MNLTLTGSQSIRIVGRPNGVGIDRDVRILTEAIGEWHRPPSFSHHRAISPLRTILDPVRPDDCMIFLERAKRRWLRRARQFVLIPNQERYPARLIGMLRRMDHVLAKTRHAEEVFSRYHDSVHRIGFTSIDRRIPEAATDYGRFLHLAGGSALKGTSVLLDVWARHPEWPVLTVLFHRRDSTATVPPNVDMIRDYLPDAALKSLQNACGIHVCPSLSEGWGHSIVEGMSCGAVVVTTDAPPMNELITSDRGVLVPHARSTPRKLGVDYHVDPDALEAAIEKLIVMQESTKAEIGRRARQWFENNDREFRDRLQVVLRGILGAP